jgi:DNA replication and repair protein RecF
MSQLDANGILHLLWPLFALLLWKSITDNRYQDLKRRTTTLGPHKADIKFLINNIDARQILSRGEQKLFSILWCCAQHEVLRKSFNIKASLIIDDIKSELDDSTFLVFLNLLKFLNNQVIFSCIDDHFSSKIEPNFREFKKFHVEQLR